MRYHDLTKHSYESIRTHPNRLDWEHQPNVFKNYDEVIKSIEFEQENETHRFLYLIAGITAKKSYPGVEYYLRTNPSAGALYPNEIYFQVRNIEGFINGIYHLNIAKSSFDLLVKINDNEGIEPYLHIDGKVDGFVFLISSVYYRSAWKYKNRAFRYCLLDAGHILGTIEASSYIYGKDLSVVYNFEKQSLNAMFGLTSKEFFTSAVIVGKIENEIVNKIQMQIPYSDPCHFFEANELIEEAYSDSIQTYSNQQRPQSLNFEFNKNQFETIIFKRRSIREFSNQPISKEKFDFIIEFLEQPYYSDLNSDVEIYIVLNRVQSMPLGVMHKNQYIKDGDFKAQAGYLCLEQSLGSQSAVTFFLVSKDTNYQALYQKAGWIGHRIYLSSNYKDIGCSGIGAYYDDEVLEFLGLGQEYMVLYALAIGN